MQWFQEFFSSIGDTINSLISLIVGLFSAVVDLVKMLPTVISMLVGSIGYLPKMLALFATLSITISVIYLVAGRNNN